MKALSGESVNTTSSTSQPVPPIKWHHEPRKRGPRERLARWYMGRVVGRFQTNTEHIVLARAGATPFAMTGGTWFEWPRGRHSEKPDAFYDLVERVSPGPYLELFARRARFGWDYWGDESLGTAALDTGAEGSPALERTE